ncbi:MAG: DUF3470 domain-containing protein, partial [Phycisphaerae bacterium]
PPQAPPLADEIADMHFRDPTQAIFPEDELPDKWSDYVEINTKYTDEWPVIDAQKDPLPEADEFKETENKREMLDPAPGG